MIEAKVTERKLLGEPCWIELGEDIQIRIDYPTRSQSTELRRLQLLWFNKAAKPDTEHWIEFYIRCTIKELKGFTIEGKPAQVVLERGIADHLTNGDPARPSEIDKNLDIVAVLAEYGMLELLCGTIQERLEMNEVDKKKLQSQDNLSVTANSNSPTSNSNRESKSLMAGSPLPQTEEKTLSPSGA